MISVLVEGHLVGDPVQRTGSSGKPFLTLRLRSAGDDGESVLISAIGFGGEVVEAAAALKSGDALAAAGPMSLSTWEKDGQTTVGLKVTATRVMSVYEAGSRRKASTAEPRP